MTHTHITDEALIAACLDRTPLPADCDVCRARHRELTALLDEMSDEAAAATDAAFPPDRLIRQRTRILQRIEHFGRQGRVLAFPVRHSQRPSMLKPRPFRRWVASAAAAGLIVGMAGGRIVNQLPGFGGPAYDTRQTIAPLQASSDPRGEEELLREIEAAVLRRGPTALGYIADVTPVWSDQ